MAQLDQSYQKVLVFPKRYQADSAAVWQRLYLQDITDASVLWSDSAYRQFSNQGDGFESSVTFVNEVSGKLFKTQLANLGTNLDFYHSLLQDSTVINFEERPLGADVQFQTTGNYWYFFDNLRKEMRVYYRSNNDLLYTHSISDSLAKQAFLKRFGSPEMWQKSQEIYTRRKVIDANVYTSYYVNIDTCYLLGSHKFPEVLNRGGRIDTILSSFYTLSIYKGDKLVDFAVLENYLGPERTGINSGIRRNNLGTAYENAYFILNGGMIVYQGHLQYYLRR